MLWNTKDMLISWECDIKSNTFRSSRFRISVTTKGFIPPGVFTFGRLNFLNVFFSFFLLRLFNLLSPVFHIHQSSIVEFDLRDIVSLEVNSKWGVCDHSFELSIWSIFDGCEILLSFLLCCLAQIQSSH